MLRTFIWVLLALVFFAGACLGFFNADRVHFNYLVGSGEVRLIVLLILVFLFGAALSLLVCAAKFIGFSTELRGLRRRLRNAETELKNLRNLPPDAGP